MRRETGQWSLRYSSDKEERGVRFAGEQRGVRRRSEGGMGFHASRSGGSSKPSNAGLLDSKMLRCS